MSFIPEYSHVRFPSVPEEFAEAAREVRENFSMLRAYEKHFQHDVELFDHVEAQQASIVVPEGDFSTNPEYWLQKKAQDEARLRLMTWTLAAARDGVLNIFHFGKTVSAINAGMKCVPGYWSDDIQKRFKTINQKMTEHFPRFEGTRHAATHLAEFFQIEQTRKHAVAGPYRGNDFKIGNESSLMLQDVLMGRAYTTTFGGKVLSCEISEKSLAQLQEIRGLVYTAFEPS
ncbi:hypothetical protein [Pelagibacterium lentulum]|uniref:Uncharacterized protein n=1 Tax=Pelagibacterium lentulum TaxID=2029865 RepID=A0A916VZN8_9HYPH|nr:hypothetical protein [Pelagibacterium lentulum]GGA54775.1 hypothetical protein GCM10011499_26170 [Pelagibacterium lentulum]